jgi:hypothetical protein
MVSLNYDTLFKGWLCTGIVALFEVKTNVGRKLQGHKVCQSAPLKLLQAERARFTGYVHKAGSNQKNILPAADLCNFKETDKT